MNSKNVLVLDSETETCRRITFLLKLAGCMVTTVKNAEEAINGIANRRMTSQQFDLLVISNYTPYISNPKLFIEIIKIGFFMPIIFIDRGEKDKNLIRLTIKNFKDCSISLCKPEDVINSIHQNLAGQKQNG
jgi:DNA-binding NtrC family response regulator